MNKKQAFKYFDVNQKNERWSWSGISSDKRTCVLTLWVDQTNFDKRSRSYRHTNFNANNSDWRNLPGNKNRINDINYCVKNLGGRFRAIFVSPVNPNEFGETREISHLKAMPNLWFEITKFDEETGEFESKSISV